MIGKLISRRDFLRASALTMAGAALIGCAAPTAAPTAAPVEEEPVEQEPVEEEPVEEEPVEEEPSEAPAEAEMVILEIQASNPEYHNAERQIWDVFEEEYPNIKVELFDVNEDTQDAFRAKVAGGYTPCFAQGWAFANVINKDNYQDFLDMSTITEIPWDKYTHNPVEMGNEMYGFGPRGLSPFKGFTFTWVYHTELMEEAGLNPRDDVTSMDSLKAWLQAGTDWVKTRDDIDFFWDLAGDTWFSGLNFPVLFGLQFPDGQIANNLAMYKGEIAVNSPESPYRHFLEFLKEAYDAGWLPENYWTREWETDMEASFISRKSMVMLHGPWPWDKAVAADPTVQLAGLPASPPAEGQATWMQWGYPPSPNGGETTVLARAVDQPWWPECQTAMVWWNSAEAVQMRGEALGLEVYLEGVTIALDSPQWNGCVNEIGVAGGKWADVQWSYEAPGDILYDPVRIPGSPGILDWESGAILEQLIALYQGEKTVQDVLDWGQSNWEKSYQW